ncbi:TonB family protein [Sphingomonas sp.]|uniref:energy transducer TonB family protein n=1 Tax=Sphingomonas sp. TaxID=28214 RepID=UPI002DB9A6F1|nr:TonB family protein [Sphingomonas sp.]HEU4968954.1 TonB family protein [Sphingomonas sp.]
MSSYRGAADGPDRAKAMVAVAAVHVALAFIILSGLRVPIVSQAVEQLKTFNLAPPPPPPPVEPPPKRQPQRAMKEAAGAPAKRAKPSPVVAPTPPLPVQSPLPAAKVAGTGSASTSGAGTRGAGTGAGGSGSGAGAGGSGGFTPARKLTKIPDSQYRRLAASGLRSGSVAINIHVNPDGTVSNCRVLRSSGSEYADSLMCQLTLAYVRFSPARDPSGRPVAQDVTWAPNWAPR